MNLFDIKGKKAIVSGGTSGLGLGIVEGYLEAGVSVVALGHNVASKDLQKKWQDKGYDGFVLLGDLTQRDDVNRLFDEALNLLGNRLDILVTSAGIQRRAAAEEFLLSDWDDVIQVNLTSVFMLCQKAANVMIVQKSGKIITIASMNSFFGGQTIPAYAASKGGIAQLTKALSNDLASKGIHVNSLAPGYMDTHMNAALVNNEVRRPMIDSRIPMQRWGTPSDMAGPAIFLASSASDYLSGAIIPVDGGYLGK